MNYNYDPLLLQSSDHPNLQLVNTKLNGANFQPWSRSIQVALNTGYKLGFIDNSYPRPDPDSLNLLQWIRCDNLMVSWLLNSIVPKLPDAFLYTNSTNELRQELCERFGQTSGLLLF